MGKYIKNFLDHQEYQSFTGTTSFKLPNVSYCENQEEVHYNPLVTYILTCKYDVTSTSQPTILYNIPCFSMMLIDDDVLLEDEKSELVSAYTFNTTGEHTVQYALPRKSIPERSFNGINSLTEVIIPEGITTIYEFAFTNCHYITSITIPDSVETTNRSAFYCDNYSYLKRVNSDTDGICYVNIKNIGRSFIGSRNNSITNITLGPNVSVLGDSCFSHLIYLKSIYIPSNIISMGYNPFYGAPNVSAITVNQNNQYYDSRNNCNAIIETATNTLKTGCQNTVIPNTVRVIGQGSFVDVSNLTDIVIPNGVTKIEHDAFWENALRELNIPSSVTIIEEKAFHYLPMLSAITVNQNNQYYDSRNNCNAIIETATNKLIASSNSTIIPYGVTEICEHAFSRRAMTSLTILETVNKIGNYAFIYTSISNLTVENNTPPTMDGKAFAQMPSDFKIYVPSGSVDTYKNADGWKEYASKIYPIE